MGCVPSCVVPCCCCCADLTCCPCCPCFPLCGCRCQNGRCHCKCDPFRKYADDSATGTSGVSKTGGGGRDANKNVDEGRMGATGAGGTTRSRDRDRGTEVTDPVLGHVIRPSSAVSHSTGMEPQVSDDSRSPSMISDHSISDEGFADSITSDDAERDGVCIDGKFYPKSARASSAKSAAAKEGRNGGPSGELTITNIISVHIADKGSQRSRRRQEEEEDEGLSMQHHQGGAPRRLAKINIKEERKKMMSELSKFKKKKPKRRKQKHRSDGEVNASFDPGLSDPVTQMQFMEESSSSPHSPHSPRSLHISSADDDSSGLDKVRTVNVMSSQADSTQQSRNKVPKGAAGDVPTNSFSRHSHVDTSSSSSRGEDMDTVPGGGGDPSTCPPPGDRQDVDSHAGSQYSADQMATNNNTTSTTTSSSQASDSASERLKKLAKSRYAVAPAPHSLPPRPPSRSGRSAASASLFTVAAALTSTPSSRPSDRASSRGLAMSRHFQGQGHRFSSFGPSGSGGTPGGVSASVNVNVNVRPMSARMPSAAPDVLAGGNGMSRGGEGSGPAGMTRHDSMWTLAGDHQGVHDLSDSGGRAAHSATNSDQDSVGSSSQGRPQSTYGIRSHSEAVHSLQRWRNLKVNPF